MLSVGANKKKMQIEIKQKKPRPNQSHEVPHQMCFFSLHFKISTRLMTTMTVITTMPRPTSDLAVEAKQLQLLCNRSFSAHGQKELANVEGSLDRRADNWVRRRKRRAAPSVKRTKAWQTGLMHPRGTPVKLDPHPPRPPAEHKRLHRRQIFAQRER